jgi:pilus assembly protein Flp/PilA
VKKERSKEGKAMLKAQMFICKLMQPLTNKEGATAVEYGIMVALIAVVIIATVTTVGTRLDGVFQTVRDALPA